MAKPKAANWIAEATTTSGTGDLILAGPLEGFSAFASIPDGLVYYTLQDGLDKECGIGTLSRGKLARTTVTASLINGVYSAPGNKLNLSGYGEVYCTVNAELFNEMNAALDKLAGIEDHATADQTAAEVPYDGSRNFMLEDGNVNDAIDQTCMNIISYSAAAVTNGIPSSVALLQRNSILTNDMYFVDVGNMTVYKSSSGKTGTIASYMLINPTTVQITLDSGTVFTAVKSNIATQEWVEARESKVVTITAADNITIDATQGLTYLVTLTAPHITVGISLANQTPNTQHQTILMLKQGTGANKVTFTPDISWAYGGAPVLSFTKDYIDVFSLVKVAGISKWFGSVVGGWYA